MAFASFLNAHDVPASTELLGKLHIRSFEDLICCDKDVVAQQTGLPRQTLDTLISHALDLTAATCWSAADMLTHSRINTLTLSTGCENLDELVGGGISSGELVELVGEPATGKSQVCFTCSVIAATQHCVVYIDTTNSFHPSRVMGVLTQQMQRHNQTCTNPADQLGDEEQNAMAETVLRNIVCYKAFDVFTLLDVLESIQKSIENAAMIIVPPPSLFTTDNNNNNNTVPFSQFGGGRLKLVVIDSLGGLLGPNLGGGGQQQQSQQPQQQQSLGHYLMMNISRTMKYMADQYNIAFLFTNYTIQADDGHKKAGLGESWSYVPNTQLFFHHQYVHSYNTMHIVRWAVLTKSSKKALGSKAYFDITEEGLVNAAAPTLPHNTGSV